MNESKGCLNWLTNCLKTKRQNEDSNKIKLEQPDVISNFITPERGITRISINNIDKEYKLDPIISEEIIIKKVVKIQKSDKIKNYEKLESDKDYNSNEIITKETKCKNCNKHFKNLIVLSCCNQLICLDCNKIHFNRHCLICNFEEESKQQLNLNNSSLTKKDRPFTESYIKVESVSDEKFDVSKQPPVTIGKRNKEFTQNLKKLDVNSSVFLYDKRSKSFDNGDYNEVLNKSRKNNYVRLVYTVLKDNKFLNSINVNSKGLRESNYNPSKMMKMVKLGPKQSEKLSKLNLHSLNGKTGDKHNILTSKASIDDILQNNDEFYFERDSVEI